MDQNISHQSRQRWLVWLAVGAVYSVLLTRLWMMSWIPLLPFMRESMFLRMMLGPFWFGVALAPITVAVTLFRSNPAAAVLTLIAYVVIMNVAQLAFEGWNTVMLIPMIANMPFTFALQLPVWGLTYLVARVLRRS